MTFYITNDSNIATIISNEEALISIENGISVFDYETDDLITKEDIQHEIENNQVIQEGD